MKSIAYVGLDVHQEHIVAVIMPEKGDRPLCERKLRNDPNEVKKFLLKWAQVYELRCCYEASSCGYVTHRWLNTVGISCEVIAPSLIPQRHGDRIKTDRRDALKLSRLYRAGELTPVYIPTEQDESVRSLLRCRQAINKEAQQSRHYVLKFLLARGLKYQGKSYWTQKHWQYMRSLKFEGPDAVVWLEYLALLDYKLLRLEELDRRIQEVAMRDPYREPVGILRCLKGVDTLTAMGLITEIIDFKRFGQAGRLMSFVGMVPSENSSGDSRCQGGITKTGNSQCRHFLIQAAWHYSKKPAVSKSLKERQAGQPADVIVHSWKAQHRLYKKFWNIALRKDRRKAVVAVARELIGFVWALMTQYGANAVPQAV
jgi:transposase